MNSQSYACPELLGPDADGLSSSARAGAAAIRVQIEPTGGGIDLEKRGQHDGEKSQPTATSNSPSSPNQTALPPRPYLPYAPLPPSSENGYDFYCRRRHEPPYGADERGEIVYVTQICLCDEDFEEYIDDENERSSPHVHRHCTPFSWDCSRCYAFLKDGKDGSEWEDGVCWNCGVLNRKVPEGGLGGGNGVVMGEPGRRERMRERCVVM